MQVRLMGTVRFELMCPCINLMSKGIDQTGLEKDFRGLKRDGGGWGEEKRLQRLMAVHIIFCQCVSVWT